MPSCLYGDESQKQVDGCIWFKRLIYNTMSNQQPSSYVIREGSTTRE